MTCDNCSKNYCYFCVTLHICPKCDAKFCGLFKKIYRNDHNEIKIANMKVDEEKVEN